MEKRRLAFTLALLATITLGLASRRIPGLFPAPLGKYPGDALWAIMAFCGWGILMPAASTARLALCALVTSYADEFSQLYQAEWINQVRRTPLGHLVLGSAFSWFDMLAYTIGVTAIVVAASALTTLRRR